MAASSASFTITSWELTALNPDGTDNTWLPSITSGAVPADPVSEFVDWLAMGNRFKLVLNCTLAGSYSDSSTVDIIGSLIRYNPALFLDYLAIYAPPGTFPVGGYTMLVPGSMTYPKTYNMPLLGQGEFLNCNENGSVSIEFLTSKTFVITHSLYLTADIEDYPRGRFVPNYFRLSKSSIYNDEEGNIDRPSVFGNTKGLSVNLGMSQRGFNTYAPDLSLPFAASFDGFLPDGTTSDLTASFFVSRLSTPAVFEDTISPFEDNLITIEIDDASAEVVENESEIVILNRHNTRNIAGFLSDYDLHEAKAITTGSTAQIDGPIYGPITWSQSGGLTTVTFVLKGTDLAQVNDYQVQFRIARQVGPSEVRMEHAMSELINTNSEPLGVTFDITSELWTRNGESAENLTVGPAERVTSVLTLNASEYDGAVVDPWLDFAGDLQSAKVEVIDPDGVVLFTETITKSSTGVWTATDHIGFTDTTQVSDTVKIFYLKEFRVPFLNYQGLQNWIGDTITFRWSVVFQDQKSTAYSAEYTIDSLLTVDDYDNSLPSPTITNIRLLDPDTTEVISDWHDLTSIRVAADVTGAGPNTYVQVMVDRFPLGVSMFNDFALEEYDPATHTLPSYVIFEQKLSDLVSELNDQPVDGGISFLVDVSELNNDERAMIYIQTYEA